MPHRLRLIPLLALVAMAFGSCTERGTQASGQPLPVPAVAGSKVPNLTSGPDGTLILSWVEPAGGVNRLRYSQLSGNGWSEPRTVAKDEKMLANWADLPSVTPLSGTLWGAHWLVSNPGGGYAHDLVVSLSQDGGASWSAPVMPHDDGTATEHGFATLFSQNGRLGVIWLDGRKKAQDSGMQMHHDKGMDHHMNMSHGMDHGMELRAATVSPDLQIGNEVVVDGLTCDCCTTDVAQTSKGAIAVYRNRTEKEIRDIYAVRLVNGEWQPETRVAEDGWKIEGCPVNGPVVEANGSHVAVAWFTAANEKPRVRLAASGDGGKTFSAPVNVVMKHALGFAGLALLPDNRVAVSWLCELPANKDRIQSTTGVCVRAVSANGTLGPVQVLSGNDTVLRGYPQLARHGDTLVAAWTKKTGNSSSIASVRVPVATL